MSDLQYKPSVQESVHGPLTQGFKQRIVAAKNKHWLAYGHLAKWAGISESFLGNVTRAELNIDSSKARRLLEVVQKLEEADPESDVVAMFTTAAASDAATKQPTPVAVTPESETIEHALSILRRHGFGVTLAMPPP